MVVFEIHLELNGVGGYLLSNIVSTGTHVYIM